MGDSLQPANFSAAALDTSITSSSLDLGTSFDSIHTALLEQIQLLEEEKNSLCQLIAELLFKNQILRQGNCPPAASESNLRAAVQGRSFKASQLRTMASPSPSPHRG